MSTLPRLLTIFACLVLATAALADVICKGKADGVYGAGCKAYTLCRGGKSYHVDCSGTRVYNSNTQSCSDRKVAPAPCRFWRDCSGMSDESFADQDVQCTAFYTCKAEIFFGHQRCNPGLVFNEKKQICDWRWNTAPPCGSKA